MPARLTLLLSLCAFFPSHSSFFLCGNNLNFICSQPSKYRLNLMHLISVCVCVCKQGDRELSGECLLPHQTLIFDCCFLKMLLAHTQEINNTCWGCRTERCWEAWLACCNLQLHSRLLGCSHMHKTTHTHANAHTQDPCRHQCVFCCLPKLKACICLPPCKAWSRWLYWLCLYLQTRWSHGRLRIHFCLFINT